MLNAMFRCVDATVGMVLVLAALTAAAAGGGAGFASRKHENWGYNAPDWTMPVEGWTPLQPGEHPRLVFRKTDLPRLKQRAETPEGQVMIERLKKLLAGRFTLWHAAGNGLLYQLTGDKTFAEKAKQQVLDVIDKKVKDA